MRPANTLRSIPLVAVSPLPLEELYRRARNFAVHALSAQFEFDDYRYVRKVLQRDDDLEIVLVCWDVGQSSSIHDHRGSNCVSRVLTGRFLERLYVDDLVSGLSVQITERLLERETVSGLNGQQIHQVANVLTGGRGALLNFYSPPLP